ncbi:MAG: nuclear transport factor 2 family protein [Hyphomonadaceae bacterium]|nr:nuclear transport factor 2 family protein [Hyphomonadaceae bacterium]
MSPDSATVASLHRYMDAFNQGDYGALTDFYCEDVLLVNAGGTKLEGRKAIVDFYRQVTSKTRRTISILQAFASGDRLAAELESEFLALEDYPEFASGPMRKGDRLYINTFAIYELRDGRYARIRSAPFKREWRRVGESA